VTCLGTATSKASAGIDKLCTMASANPDCTNDVNGSSQPCSINTDCALSGVCDAGTCAYPSGAKWTLLVNSAVSGNIGPTYCGSPSGAFVE
jgi:hypothetical protein